MKNIIKKFNNIHFYSICFIILISGVFCFNFIKKPLFLRGDSLFHLSRIQGLSNYFTSPVNFHTFNHQGKAVNLFYPSQIIFVVSIINLFLHNFVLSFKLFIYLLVTFGMLNMYYILYKIKGNAFVGICGSMLFIFDNYFIGNIYERLAVGEVQAYVFLPLVIYGCYELFFGNYKKWFILPIGFALVAYSHLLSLMIVTGFAGVLFVVSLFTNKYNVEKFKFLMLAGVVTILLVAVQIVPIIEQTKAFDLYTTWDMPNIGSTVRPLMKMLDYSTGNNFFRFMFGIATLMLMIFGLFRINKLNPFEMTLYISSLLLLLLQTKFVPWNILEHTPITKVQYLWRFNAFITLFLVISVTSHLFKDNLVSKRNIITSIIIVIGMVYLHFGAVLHYYKSALPKGPLRVIHNDFALKRATKNYSQMDYSNMIQHLNHNRHYNKTRPTLVDDKVTKVNEQISSSVFKTTFFSSTNKKQIVNLPITLYKGTTVNVNNKVVKTFVSKKGTLAFNIFKKGKIAVEVKNSWTILARIFQVVSIITWIGLLVYIYRNKIKL